jgi:hypothetical protein
MAKIRIAAKTRKERKKYRGWTHETPSSQGSPTTPGTERRTANGHEWTRRQKRTADEPAVAKAMAGKLQIYADG